MFEDILLTEPHLLITSLIGMKFLGTFHALLFGFLMEITGKLQTADLSWLLDPMKDTLDTWMGS
jgi:hypothetical protein